MRDQASYYQPRPKREKPVAADDVPLKEGSTINLDLNWKGAEAGAAPGQGGPMASSFMLELDRVRADKLEHSACLE